MYKTDDGIINITVAKNISDVVFNPADWSIVNIPCDYQKAEVLSKNLYNMPTHRHIVLALNRHRRKDRIKGLSSLSAFDDKNWKFLDSVSISYGKPSTCSNNGFLPLSEHGYIFYKGDSPDAKGTGWASNGEYQNATNDWSLFSQNIEDLYFVQTYYQKFSWELQLLMMTMCGRREYSRFIYDLSQNSMSSSEVHSLYVFCKKYNLKVDLIVSDENTANNILEYSEKSKNKSIEEVTKK